MKFLTNKRNIKIVSLILVLVTISIAILPNYASAINILEDEDTKNGGKLFRPFFKFIAFVGDLVMKALQEYFIGDPDIKTQGISRIDEEGDFYIRYSPAIIFSRTSSRIRC